VKQESYDVTKTAGAKHLTKKSSAHLVSNVASLGITKIFLCKMKCGINTYRCRIAPSSNVNKSNHETIEILSWLFSHKKMWKVTGISHGHNTNKKPFQTHYGVNTTHLPTYVRNSVLAITESADTIRLSNSCEHDTVILD
jgi:hypothetical protein